MLEDKEFLINTIKPIIESKLDTKFVNFFINKKNLDKWVGGCSLRIFWSADNHPECQKIYGDTISFNMSEIKTFYREYRISKILDEKLY